LKWAPWGLLTFEQTPSNLRERVLPRFGEYLPTVVKGVRSTQTLADLPGFGGVYAGQATG
jgi:hypothetical protein